MINQFVEGATVEKNGARENISHLRVMEKCKFEARQQQQEITTYAQQQALASMGSETHLNKSMGAPHLSLREVIVIYAQEHDIQFFPTVRCTHDGLQVYGFATPSIYNVDSINQQVLV